jgi:hypothetical protein
MSVSVFQVGSQDPGSRCNFTNSSQRTSNNVDLVVVLLVFVGHVNIFHKASSQNGSHASC